LGANVLIYEGQFQPSQAEPNVNNSSPSISNPVTAPTLTAVAGSTNLGAGTYKVSYSFTNAGGETLASSKSTITIAAGEAIRVSAISLITNATAINYYLTPIAGGTDVYLSSSNSGGSSIDLESVQGFAKFWVRHQVGSSDPTGVYQAQLTVSSIDIG
jgi:hypothetical protein